MPNTQYVYKFEVFHDNKVKLFVTADQVCENIEGLSRTALFRIIRNLYPKNIWTPENIKIKKVNIPINKVVKKSLPMGEIKDDEVVRLD